jgi:hypothetical protein
MTWLATVNLSRYTLHQVVTEYKVVRLSVLYQFWHRGAYTLHFDHGSQNNLCCLYDSAYSCLVALGGSSGNHKDYFTLERPGLGRHMEHSSVVFDIQRTVVVIYSYNKSKRDALFLNFILVKNSICFGQIYCPSSGVSILYSQQLVFVVLVMLTVC